MDIFADILVMVAYLIKVLHGVGYI